MENDKFIEILQHVYEERILEIKHIYQTKINERDEIIKELKDKIIELERRLDQQDNKLIQVYNNQYNYQTRGSDMSNINQSHSGDGDNVGNDKNE